MMMTKINQEKVIKCKNIIDLAYLHKFKKVLSLVVVNLNFRVSEQELNHFGLAVGRRQHQRRRAVRLAPVLVGLRVAEEQPHLVKRYGNIF